MIRDDFRNEVGELCRAARELLAVFDRQQAQAEAARERAEASRAVFDRYMESFRSGAEPAHPEDRSRSLLQALKSASMEGAQETLRSSMDLNRQWETGFCDLYEALIRLNTYPEVRGAVEQIAARVRALRLLQLTSEEDVDAVLLPKPPASFGRIPEAGDAPGMEAFRKERGERIGHFISNMDDQTDEGLSRLELTRGHLEELLAAAEALR